MIIYDENLKEGLTEFGIEIPLHHSRAANTFKKLESHKLLGPKINHWHIKSVNETMKIKTRAYVGEDGQGIYNMTISLGECSFTRYANGESLIYCIPSEETTDWIDINIENKTIELRLK